MGRLFLNLLPQVIIMMPTKHYDQVHLGDNRSNMSSGKRMSHITVACKGMHWIGVHAMMQYFSQGMSLIGRKCIFLAGKWKNLNYYAQSILVMLSHHKDNDDWALLHPLWTPGN